MAFILKEKNETIAVVAWKDRSVTCSQDDYKRYLETFVDGKQDETILKLAGEPTRFILRTDLSWQQKQKLRSKNLKVLGRKVQIDANYSSELLRLHLVAIKNPPDAPAGKQLDFVKDADGNAARTLLNVLDQAGVVADLVVAMQNAVKDEKEDAEAKNS